MTPQYRILRTGPNGRAPTVLHPTLRSAADEALRLAGQHPGDTFEILQIVGVARTSEPSIFWNDGFGPPEDAGGGHFHFQDCDGNEVPLVADVQCEPETPRRNLEAGERIREGDEVWVSEDDGWMTYLPGAYGNKVLPHTKSRRPIRPKQDPPADHEWRYRGLGWWSDSASRFAFSTSEKPEDTRTGSGMTSGIPATHYWEAVPVPGAEQ